MNYSNNGNKQKKTDARDVLRPSGGYQQLKVYQIATLIHDITVRFAQLYIPANSRTRDQMEQAARSGKQNIAEGSMDAATSAKLEINLYNVARGSLEELKIDYLDYLRQHNAVLWSKDDPLAQRFIAMRIAENKQFREFIRWAENNHPTVNSCSVPLKSVLVANAAILLITAESFWLKQLIASKMDNFLREGGFTERMYHIRSGKINKKP